MNLGLKNKIALILASSKGLGFACARKFYREGANVIINSRSKENLEQAKIKIEKLKNTDFNNQIIPIVADLSNERDIENLVQKSTELFGRIDILVHNTGGPPSGPIISITKKEWEDSINLNLISFIRISELVIPIMQKQKFGRIIALTSVSVKQPLNNMVLSNTTRLGLLGYAKTLANEYAKDNILINLVCPGPNLTDRMKELIEQMAKKSNRSREEIKSSWIDQIPLGRMGKPNEVANLVLFLASNKANYITGTAIQVDGGFTKSIL
ncbi:MAG: SDR family oxidoreductase [Candidatus Lokiarchaeota archaeon]|nr:SDR family oxidoreductase [Candidatus Lokiarchaeota archaeon]